MSREFRLNYVISFIFYLYLILHACVQIFNVTGNLEKFCKVLETKQALGVHANLATGQKEQGRCMNSLKKFNVEGRFETYKFHKNYVEILQELVQFQKQT